MNHRNIKGANKSTKIAIIAYIKAYCIEMNEEKNLKSSTFSTAFSAFSEMYSALWPKLEKFSAYDIRKVFIGVYKTKWRAESSLAHNNAMIIEKL